jgi:hypothetical protein
MTEYEPASRWARIAGGILLVAFAAALAIWSNPPDLSTGASTDQGLADAVRAVRSYALAASLVGVVLNGTLAASFAVLGWSAVRAGIFPAPGYGLPWRSRRITGISARSIGIFMLFVAALTLPRIWSDIRAVYTVLSL